LTSPFATVLSVAGNEALVEVTDRNVCPRCAAGNGCGAGIFGVDKDPVSLTVRIDDGVRIATGDQVRLSLAPADLVRASIYAYGAPLAGLLLAAGLAYWLVDPLGDLMAALVSISGLLGGGVAGRILAHRHACVSRISPSIAGLANVEKPGH
jgi:sigma-E factor negative regulatory protein RseC